MSRMVNIGIFNVSSKYECQIPSYKRVTKFRILCFVNKVKFIFIAYICVVLLSFVDDIIYEHIE